MSIEMRKVGIARRTGFAESACFVTCRLRDAISDSRCQELVQRQNHWLHRVALQGINPAERKPRAHKLLFGHLDDVLDRSQGSAALTRSYQARLLTRALWKYHGSSYHLLGYCIMPNHLHVLFYPRLSRSGAEQLRSFDPLGEHPDPESPLKAILKAWKKVLSTDAVPGRPASAIGWHPNSYLQVLHSEEELQRTRDYLAYNPVKAGLAEQPYQWPWSSSYRRRTRQGNAARSLPVIPT